MVKVYIDMDEYYPFYSLRLDADKAFPEHDAVFNMDKNTLEEILDLQIQAGKLQTRLRQLYQLHGGK